MTECMHARRRGEHRGDGKGDQRAVKHSNVEHVTACEIGSQGKLRRPTDCLSFKQEIIPDWLRVIRERG